MSRSTREKRKTAAEKDTLTALKKLHGTTDIPDKDRLIDEIYMKRREKTRTPSMSGTLKLGKNGRITLPKTFRQRLGLNEKTRIIIRDHEGYITLTPVTTHENPTEALNRSVRPTPPVDDSKETARRHLHNKMRRQAGEELIASLETKEHPVPEGFINETIRRTREGKRSEKDGA